MSTPSINYREALQSFLNVQDKTSYISHSFSTTKDKKESASFDEVCTLTQIAIRGLKLQRLEKAEKPYIIKAQAKAIKAYLTKVKDNLDVVDYTSQIFLNLFVDEVDAEIKQLKALSIYYEPDLKSFSDAELAAIPPQSLYEQGVRNQDTKIRHAKMAALQKGSVSKSIKDYGIRDQEALIEIAKLASLHDPDGSMISEHIHKYGIDDQAVLIEIAKQSAQKNGPKTSICIRNYCIKEQQALIEIAKLAVLQDIASVDFIKNYCRDQNGKIEIAKTAAQKDPEYTALNFQKFNIKEQQGSIEVAKIIARLSGVAVSQCIIKFGIVDKNALFEIAKLAAEQSGYTTSHHIQKYGITSEIDRFVIFTISFKQNPKNTLEYIDNYNISAFKEKKLSIRSTFEDVQKAFKWPAEFAPVFKEFKEEAPDIQDIFILIYIGCRLKFLQETPFLNDPEPFLNDPRLWYSILMYSDYNMCYHFIDMVFDLDEKQAKLYKKYSSPDYLELPALFYCYSSKSEEDVKTYHAFLKEKRVLKDGMLLKALLDVMQSLIVKHQFKPEEVMRLLRKAFNENIKSNLFGIQGILQCGGEEILRNECRKDNPNLDAVYQIAFSRVVPIKHIENFSQKYERTFGKCAIPTAPLIYAGRLSQLPLKVGKEPLSLFGFFVHSVLDGDYPKIRYIQKQSHLKSIFRDNPDLERDWQKEVEVPLEEYLNTTLSKITFNPQRFLIDKILSDKHLPREKYPLLYQFLETKDTGISKGLSETLEKTAINTKKSTDQKVILRNILSILEDLSKPNVKNKAVKQLKALIKAKQQLKDLPLILENLDDIEELLKIIESKKQPTISSGSTLLGQNNADKVQRYVDQFKKAADEIRHRFLVEDEEHQRLLLQKDLIDLYSNGEATLLGQLNLLSKIRGKIVQGHEEFLNDISGIITALKKQKQTYEGFTLINTDRFDLMLLCGTQVQGSCQRIDGDPKINICLLAYLLDGKIRLIAIKDKEGNIVARAILRLLSSKEPGFSYSSFISGNPVLMLERVYSNISDLSLTDAINKFAKAEAKRLDVSIYKDDDKGKVCLESDGSIAPWEYVDSANGIKKDGEFKITKASLLI